MYQYEMKCDQEGLELHRGSPWFMLDGRKQLPCKECSSQLGRHVPCTAQPRSSVSSVVSVGVLVLGFACGFISINLEMETS